MKHINESIRDRKGNIIHVIAKSDLEYGDIVKDTSGKYYIFLKYVKDMFFYWNDNNTTFGWELSRYDEALKWDARFSGYDITEIYKTSKVIKIPKKKDISDNVDFLSIYTQKELEKLVGEYRYLKL